MKIPIALCLLALFFVTGCETTTTKNGTLEERMARYAAATDPSVEPPPPAEGPNDIPAEGPLDVNRNPALVPSPLLRNSAASDSP
jgi:hypothetical protein